MRHQEFRPLNLIALLLSAFLLAACLSSGSDDDADGGDGDQNPPPGGGGNSAPTITGNPPPAVVVGDEYSFTPNASDDDPGDTLSFEIDNLPGWADFDMGSGELSGAPEAGDVDIYEDISITVSDGDLSDSLGPFSIEVTQSALGALTLSWAAPTQNEDGSPIGDSLAGYRIYRGTESGNYTSTTTIDQPGMTTYVMENLSPNTYFFVATAVNEAGNESAFSNEATGVVSAN